MTALALSPPRTLVLARLMHDDPRFARGALLLLLMVLPLSAALVFDVRLFQGESPWIKPLKFALSLTMYLGTLAWAARYLPNRVRDARWFRVYQWLVLGCIAAEMLWIGGAALFATGSHFNVASPAMSTLYGLMGVAAVTLTSAAAFYGALIWRHSDAPETSMIGLSFIATFVATVIVAGYMSSTLGHHVAVPETGARLPIVGWSAEVGDLRVAHFLATHIMQIVPLAWFMLATIRTPPRGTGAALTLLCLALVAATFTQALQGLPLVSILR
jgi:hypothetical protein